MTSRPTGSPRTPAREGAPRLHRPPGQGHARLANERRRIVGQLYERPVEARLRPVVVALTEKDYGRLRHHPRAGLGLAATARIDCEAHDVLGTFDVAVEPSNVRRAAVARQVRLEVHHRLGAARRVVHAPELEQRVAQRAEGSRVLRVRVDVALCECARLLEAVLVEEHQALEVERRRVARVDTEGGVGRRPRVEVKARIGRLASLADPRAPEQNPERVLVRVLLGRPLEGRDDLVDGRASVWRLQREAPGGCVGRPDGVPRRRDSLCLGGFLAAAADQRDEEREGWNRSTHGSSLQFPSTSSTVPPCRVLAGRLPTGTPGTETA